MKNILRAAGMATATTAMLILTSCFSSNETENAEKIGIDTIKSVNLTEDQVDSLFAVLEDRMMAMEGMSDIRSINFDDLVVAFGGAVKAQPDNMKVHLGYVSAELMSLTNKKGIIDLVDSLDSYFSTVSTRGGTDTPRGTPTRGESDSKQNNFFKSSFERNGISGLALSLTAKTPELIVRQTSQSPTIPEWLTISKIQETIETEIMPTLDNILNTFEGMIRMGDNSQEEITVDGESYIIDMTEVYILNATMHLLRSSLGIFTAYNWDVYTSSSDKSYSWVDDIINLSDLPDTLLIKLRGDTLIQKELLNRETYSYYYDIMKYNLERSDFLSIRKNNHAKAYKDLLAVPVKLKKAIDILEARDQDQHNNIVKRSFLMDAEAEMVDIYEEMKDNGISEELAKNFKSPKDIASFIETLLSGEYKFDETIEVRDYIDFYDEDDRWIGWDYEYKDVDIKVTMNISKFFTAPAKSLKEYLPLYRFVDRKNIIKEKMYWEWSMWRSSNEVSVRNYNREIKLDFDQKPIDTTTTSSSITIYTFQNSYINRRDYYEVFRPIEFLNSSGEVISDDDEYPLYFKDYTFGGIFPGMTRDKWIEIVKHFL